MVERLFALLLLTAAQRGAGTPGTSVPLRHGFSAGLAARGMDATRALGPSETKEQAAPMEVFGSKYKCWPWDYQWCYGDNVGVRHDRTALYVPSGDRATRRDDCEPGLQNQPITAIFIQWVFSRAFDEYKSRLVGPTGSTSTDARARALAQRNSRLT